MVAVRRRCVTCTRTYEGPGERNVEISDDQLN